MEARLRLFSYFRSSAAYRVRIVLETKGLPWDIVPVHMLRDGGEQHKPEYRAVNPQRLVRLPGERRQIRQHGDARRRRRPIRAWPQRASDDLVSDRSGLCRRQQAHPAA